MNNIEPEEYNINDQLFECKHCGFTLFYSCTCNSSSNGFNFPGLDWLNKSMDILICGECGFIHWFASKLPSEIDIPKYSLSSDTTKESVKPEKDSSDLSAPSECMSCGKLIPKGYDRCYSCGWTYKEPLKE
jgi:hypothetical protein